MKQQKTPRKGMTKKMKEKHNNLERGRAPVKRGFVCLLVLGMLLILMACHTAKPENRKGAEDGNSSAVTDKADDTQGDPSASNGGKGTLVNDEPSVTHQPGNGEETDLKNEGLHSDAGANGSGENYEPAVDDTNQEQTHSHEWTDNGVGVVCYECGMLHHGHMWDPVYATVTVDDYEVICITRCAHCGVDIGTGAAAVEHVYAEMDKGNSGQTWESYEQVKVGSHEQQIVAKYICSLCGAEKSGEELVDSSASAHSHDWTDYGVGVVFYDCGMLNHGHMWKPMYTTEVVDDYGMKEVILCSVCEEDVSALLDSGASMKQHRQETGCTSSGYYTTAIYAKVGSHEEQVVYSYCCSRCGAIKLAG